MSRQKKKKKQTKKTTKKNKTKKKKKKTKKKNKTKKNCSSSLYSFRSNCESNLFIFIDYIRNLIGRGHITCRVIFRHPVILPSQVILLPHVTSVSAFHVQGNAGLPAILLLQIILPSGDVIDVSAVAVVKVRSDKQLLPV